MQKNVCELEAQPSHWGMKEQKLVAIRTLCNLKQIRFFKTGYELPLALVETFVLCPEAGGVDRNFKFMVVFTDLNQFEITAQASSLGQVVPWFDQQKGQDSDQIPPANKISVDHLICYE